MPDPIAHVIGARPNFMKAAPVIAALRALGVAQTIIHTGQHYDETLSDVFFRDLDLPAPDHHLGVGSGSQAGQTAALMVALEKVLLEVRPSIAVVYGDVNSTIAAALVAAKIGTPVAHVEAGLRSFDDSMPEEINRRVTDLLSTLLFTTSPEAEANLVSMGLPSTAIHFVGNPMIDTLMSNLDRFDPEAVKARLGVVAPYVVATLHRAANVDEPAAARRVVAMLRDVSAAVPVVVPLHPRGRPSLESAGLLSNDRLLVIEPLGYVEFVSLVRGAAAVITDSGGIQEETTVLGIPCLTVRPNTERPITISHGTNRLIEPEDVPVAVQDILRDRAIDRTGAAPPVGDLPTVDPPPLWDGHAGERIAVIIETWQTDRHPPLAARQRSPE